ncbi:MAG: flagellar export protein FliJ [Magnetococcales bacterium]|nr:flagellar export protein FliJ [Magnetococcales bacterium]
MVNRFSRLEELRRLKEEAAGQAFARTLVRIEELRLKMARLDQETAEEKRAAIEALAAPGAQRPDPTLLDAYLAGQMWRRNRLEMALRRARQESEQARETWRGTRMQLQQAELLAEKEQARQKQEEHRQEVKEMDMVAIHRIGHDPIGRFQARRGVA